MNANRPHRGATEEEANRITPYVIGAVVYTAVLNGLMYDLIDTLKDERAYNDRATCSMTTPASNTRWWSSWKMLASVIGSATPAEVSCKVQGQ